MRRQILIFTFVSVFLALPVWASWAVTRGLPEAAFWIFLLIDLVGVGLGFTAIFSDLPKKNPKLYFLDWIGYTWLGVFAFLLFTAVLVSILRMILPANSISSLLPTGIFIFLCGWALWGGMRLPPIRRYRKSFSFTSASIDRPFRIAQLSDVHIGMLHLRQPWLERVVERLNAEKPDIAVITGDLIEASFESIAHELEPLRNVVAPLGRYYVTGNHEYYYGGGIWEEKLKSLGWIPLHSRSEMIQYDRLQIQIAGVPDRVGKHSDARVKLDYDSALQENGTLNGESKIDPIFKILLVHQPSEVFQIGSIKPDLVLTGHTHGGQVFPFRPFVRWVQPVVSGWKKVAGTLLFVHQGTGFWGPPMRLGSTSEIALIEVEGS